MSFRVKKDKGKHMLQAPPAPEPVKVVLAQTADQIAATEIIDNKIKILTGAHQVLASEMIDLLLEIRFLLR